MERKNFRVNIRFLFSLAAIVFLLGVFSITAINWRLKEYALEDAREKAMMLLDRNIATHAYFSHQLKPVVFEKLKGVADDSYFEPRWMSSTYAVREIDDYYQSLARGRYYYKEAAINARSPENEADDFEREFIKSLNQPGGDIDELAEVRVIGGNPYYTVLRRGETMEQICLRCHSSADAAPAELVAHYGPKRSFGRHEGEVVSAISARIPLDSAYAGVHRIIVFLAAVCILVLLAATALATYLGKRWIYDPIARIGAKAKDISENPEQIGVQIDLPAGRELAELGGAFNSMSLQLRQERDELENKIAERTRDLEEANTALKREISMREETIGKLEEAMAKIRTLSGLLPICMHCKKIRDSRGYWNQVETYLEQHSEAMLSHSICRECAERLYPDCDIYHD